MEASRGFFEGRRPLNLRPIGNGPTKALADYQNVPHVIGTLLAKRLCTLHELDTVYGCKDAYDMLEVAMVDDYNAALMNQE